MQSTIYGSVLLNLVVANEAVKSYIARYQADILGHLKLVVNTVSMEEGVRQR